MAPLLVPSSGGTFDVLVDGTGRRATGVRYLDAARQPREVHAAHVVLAAGAFETPRLLLRNGLANAQFFAADLTQDQRGTPWMRQGFDRLLLDPPRSGADEVLKQLPLKDIQRIVYVSCHPGSLARDAGFLVNERGYRLVSAGVMDMFPHTAHVESIALFER